MTDDAGARQLAAILAHLRQTHTQAWTLIGDLLMPMDGETVGAWQARVNRDTPRLLANLRELLAASEVRLTDPAVLAGLVGEGVGRGAAWADAQALAAGTPLADAPAVVAGGLRLVEQTLAREAAGDLAKLHAGMLRSASPILRAVTSRATTALATGTITLREAVTMAVEDAARSGLPGIVDRAGRAWRPEVYAEMALRTTYVRAATQGKLDRLQALGHNLVRVADTPGSCGACSPWENRVLAITGPAVPPATGTVDQARRAGLWHPRCTHTADLYIPGRSTPIPTPDAPTVTQQNENRAQRAMERQADETARAAAAVRTSSTRQAARIAQTRLTTWLQAHPARARAVGLPIVPTPPARTSGGTAR